MDVWKGLIDAIPIWQHRITTLILELYFFSYSYGYMSLSCILLWLPLFISQDPDKVFHRKTEEKEKEKEERKDEEDKREKKINFEGKCTES